MAEAPVAASDYVAVQTPSSANKNRLEVAFDAVENPQESQSKQALGADGKIVPLSQLFSFADKTDKLLMAVGTVGALTAGLSQPIQIVLFGDILNSFNPTKPMQAGQFRDDINKVSRNFAIVGAAVVVCCFIQVATWSVTASRQAKRIRSAYVSSILNKEIGWFDVNEPMQLSTRVADSTAWARKVGDGLHFFSMAVSGITIGLIKGWELALILLAFTPFIAFTAFLAMKVLSTATQAGIESYGKAGAIAQESLSNIRTVHMFNAIDHFVKKYEGALGLSTQAGIKKGFAVGWGTGLMFFTVFCTYALRNCYDGGRVLTVFFSIIMGAMALGQAGPSVQAIFSALINRASLIDPLSEDGKKLERVSGRIEIDSVSFAYPSRPEVKVCSNYSLRIEAGETVALVGPSGSGKSTIVSLLERFYDPLSGSVKLDGVDVRELNVKWLRQQSSATDEQVIEAAKMANAYTFIKEFPQGFQTEVGERGAQLSGGQKQRIAIARAIIKNPPILLLDEATSALDTESERIVQESLDKLLASSNRTTIIVAHRLSTIRNANKIAVHSRGSIVELGTHDELMQIPNGHYRLLVEAQNRSKDDDLDEMKEMQSTMTKTGSFSSRSSSYRNMERTNSKVSVKAKNDAETVDSDSNGRQDS
ncbi:hypothetical protein PINS_up015229 [Pythium insidiosum]|nr:hypothetical protein PINS_up015229 [Pythium insidiosum]